LVQGGQLAEIKASKPAQRLAKFKNGLLAIRSNAAHIPLPQ